MMHILQNFVQISEVPFEISHTILYPYTPKYALYEVLKVLRYRRIMTS